MTIWPKNEGGVVSNILRGVVCMTMFPYKSHDALTQRVASYHRIHADLSEVVCHLATTTTGENLILF